MMMPSSSDMPFTPKGENCAGINLQFHNHNTSTKSKPRIPLHQEVKSDTWVVPTSTKAIRAVNPVTFAFNRLADKVKLGSQRSDGKDPISLAVSSDREILLSQMSWCLLTHHRIFFRFAEWWPQISFRLWTLHRGNQGKLVTSHLHMPVLHFVLHLNGQTVTSCTVGFGSFHDARCTTESWLRKCMRNFVYPKGYRRTPLLSRASYWS